MKLELKHLSPYLPYSLKGIFTDLPKGKTFELTEIIINKGDDNYDSNIDVSGVPGRFGGHTSDIYNFKPILRPISDLAKIIQFDSEEFIPLIYLYNISNEQKPHNELNYEFIDSWGAGKILKVFHYNKLDYTEFIYSEFNFRKDTHYEKGFYRYGMTLPHSISVHSEIKNQYFIHDLLFKWQFDVFGLIEADLAIDINTVHELLNG